MQILEAEVVTADGMVRTANACTHPDLFWAIKGGGGGSFGIITRLTLQTHNLPAVFGGAFVRVKANWSCIPAFGPRIIEFYSQVLFNLHWGEQIAFRPDNLCAISMVFQALDRAQAKAIWAPFFDWITSFPDEFTMLGEPAVLALPARLFWDPATLKQAPGVVLSDNRPGAPEAHVFWASNLKRRGRCCTGTNQLGFLRRCLSPRPTHASRTLCLLHLAIGTSRCT